MTDNPKRDALGRWKPGVSGNTRGTVKGQSWREILARIYDLRPEQKFITQKSTNKEVDAYNLVLSAREGNFKAIKFIIEHMESKPAQYNINENLEIDMTDMADAIDDAHNKAIKDYEDAESDV